MSCGLANWSWLRSNRYLALKYFLFICLAHHIFFLALADLIKVLFSLNGCLTTINTYPLLNLNFRQIASNLFFGFLITSSTFFRLLFPMHKLNIIKRINFINFLNNHQWILFQCIYLGFHLFELLFDLFEIAWQECLFVN